jgi:putative addiction module component (TIGR02574 family)
MKDLAEIMKLPVAERLEIISAIWSSIDPVEVPVTEDELAEVNAAVDDYEQHPDDVVSFEDFEARLMADDAETDHPSRG